MENSTIPIVDLSPFFTDDNEDGKKKAIEVISQACSEFGFFQAMNHGVPLGLLGRAMELSKTFFVNPNEEKLKFSPHSDAPLPTGYRTDGKKEFLLMRPPGTSFNVFPNKPLELRKVMEELFIYFSKIGQLMESIVNDCLGLPPNVLKEYNNDRSRDIMLAHHYFPATKTNNIGAPGHEDVNCITFVFQDDVGGLEVQHNEKWIPVTPHESALVVNIGSVIQVLSNNKFKSGTHRVMSAEGRSRYSTVFFYNIHEDKWIEPLPQFTKKIGEPPKYRGFLQKEFLALREQKTRTPSTSEVRLPVTHYAIPTYETRI